MYANSNSAVTTTNIFSPVDGQLRTGYAIDTSGGAGLTPNNFYNYIVYFTNYNGLPTNSSPVSTYTLAYYSDASVNALSSSSLQYSWRGYYSDISNVYQNGLLITPDTSNNTRPSLPSTVNIGSITKTGLNPNTSYYYDVSLVNAAGVTTTISRKSAFTCASGVSLTPTPIDTTQIRVNWTGTYSSALVTSTNGSISTTTKQNYTSSTTPQANVTGYVYNTGLSSNTQYTYTVTLYNGNNVATSLTSQSAYTYPIVPTIASATSITDKTCTITFTEPTGTGTITYTLTGGTLGTKSTNTYTVTGLIDNSANSLTLAAANSSATSTSTAYTVTTLPSAPSFTASAGTTSTTLSVTKPSGTISSYGFSGGESTSVLGTPSTFTANCTATVNNLLQNTAYTFYLSAYNSTSLLRSASGSLAFTTDPTAPTSFTGSSTVSSISLSWSYPSSYAWIYDIRSGGTKNATESSAVTTGSCSFSSLTSNTQYTYYLKIKGLSGNYSSDATYSIYTYPDSFTVSASSITATTCTLTISAVPSGTITFSLSGGGSLDTQSNNTFHVTGLTASSTYNLTLKATGVGLYTEASTGNFTTISDTPTVTTTGSPTISGSQYTFTSSGTFKVSIDKTIYYFLVGGGGGGASSFGTAGTGGSGGGSTTGSATFLAGKIYTITRGAGGSGDCNGSNSTITQDTTTIATAGYGKNGPMGGDATGPSGGSGTYTGGKGGDSYGGTASMVTKGGDGPSVSFNGTTYQYGAGGGGGSTSTTSHLGEGGTSGGGQGASPNRNATTATGYGGGGGGAQGDNHTPGNGQNGIVILYY